MPGVRKGIVWDLPRRRLALKEHRSLAARLAAERYGSVLVMPRTWKSALAPFLAGIPERTGFAGEARFGLLNDLRFGEKKTAPHDRPLRRAGPAERLGLAGRLAEARTRCARAGGGGMARPAGGCRMTAGRWSPLRRARSDRASAGRYFAELARKLTAEGFAIWVLGSPAEAPLAAEIVGAAGPAARDLTSNDLRNAILALKCAGACVSNDSGLVHVAAAMGTPTIGIFGPTSPWHWAPLNPLAAVIETLTDVPCRPCHKPTCRLIHHRCMRDIPAAQVLPAVYRALGRIADRA